VRKILNNIQFEMEGVLFSKNIAMTKTSTSFSS